jgi:hypothetical protein
MTGIKSLQLCPWDSADVCGCLLELDDTVVLIPPLSLSPETIHTQLMATLTITEKKNTFQFEGKVLLLTKLFKTWNPA